MKTPCIRLCTLDPVRGICLGCGRTLHEIGNWARYADAERDVIIAALPVRLATLPAQPHNTR